MRQNPKLSGTAHNVFGIQVGVGITICVRNSQSTERFIKYRRVPEFARKLEKLDALKAAEDLNGIEWQTLTPNVKNAWLTEGLEAEFETLLPLGTKEAKTSFSADIQTIFRTYSLGVSTNRDEWIYDFNRDELSQDMRRFIDFYNLEVQRWGNHPNKKDSFDAFVSYNSKDIKWSSTLKTAAKAGKTATFDEANIRTAIYRPFCKTNLLYDKVLIDRPGAFDRYFSTPETENRVICVSAGGSQSHFQCLITDCIPDLHFTGDSQCFPFYTYSADGEHRSENITSYALKQFQDKYGSSTGRWDVFHYVYALLHHPQYRAKYAQNLKRELPRVPLDVDEFRTFVDVGRSLADLHVGFESAPFDSQIKIIETRAPKEPLSFRTEVMKWQDDKRVLKLNSTLSLGGFTPEHFAYKLGNRAALDWIVESFKVKTDVRSEISSDPNRRDEPKYILDLVRRVAHVSRETMRLVGELPTMPSGK